MGYEHGRDGAWQLDSGPMQGYPQAYPPLWKRILASFFALARSSGQVAPCLRSTPTSTDLRADSGCRKGQNYNSGSQKGSTDNCTAR